jgi:Ca2+-transporting ATPase
VPDHLGDVESGLQLLGLIGVADPVRGTAAATIESFRTAGISPVLISGDNALTADAVAAQVGIAPLRGGRAVYARSSPEDKLRIIRELQQAGEIVAMTGDGVNDAPALRQADIGIAMGRRGTEAARQAADLVLADDELSTLTAAVEEGRRVYDNIRRFMLFALAGGSAEVAVMLLGPLVGLGIPLLPGQILWVNLLTHGLPGVAMGAEPVEPDTLQRPPRPPGQSVLGGGLWPRIAVLAGIVTLISLAAGAFVGTRNAEWQSALFTTLATAQFGIAAGVRSRGRRGRAWFLPAAVASACLLQLGALYTTPLQDLLDTRPLSALQLLWTAAAGLVAYLVSRALTAARRT